MGVDLTVKGLNANRSSNVLSHSMLELAIKDEDYIPLEAMARFMRLAHMYEHKEVFEMVVERVIQLCINAKDNKILVCKGKALQLLLAMDLLSAMHRKCNPSASPRVVSGGGKVINESCFGSGGIKSSVYLHWNETKPQEEAKSKIAFMVSHSHALFSI